MTDAATRGAWVAPVLAGLAVLFLGIGFALVPTWQGRQSEAGTAAAPAAGEGSPSPAAAAPAYDPDAPPLASADLQLVAEAGDDHALLDQLEFFVWLSEGGADAR